MESARSTGNFNRRITVADSNNIIAILDMNANNSKYQAFEKDYLVEFQAVLEDLKITVGLMGLAEAPWPEVNALMNEAEKMAEIARIRTQGQKIGLGLYIAEGNGPWRYESEVVLQNQGGSETHVPILVPFLSSNETLLMSGNFKLGVKIEPKWNQPLKANDYLIIKGTWRQIVSFSKKKDDGINALTARIAALELALEGRLINLPANSLLGKSATAGTVEVISRSTFKAADSDAIGGISIDRIVSGGNAAKVNGGLSISPKTTFNSNSSGFFDCWGAWADDIYPTGTNHLQGISIRHGNLINSWGLQIAGQHNLSELWFRNNSANTFAPWRRMWHEANFSPTAHSQVFSPITSVGQAVSTGAIPTGIANAYGLEVLGAATNTTANAAYFCFHRPSIFATYFGLDTDNILKVGGWSMGAKFRMWHEQFGIPVWQAPSDVRLKKQISNIKSALELILECKPIRFKYNSEIKATELYGSKKEREKYHYGFIAQDFPIGDLTYTKENGYLGIDYIEIIPFLVRAIQEISEETKALKSGLS